jgi:hypothetical protein
VEILRTEPIALANAKPARGFYGAQRIRDRWRTCLKATASRSLSVLLFSTVLASTPASFGQSRAANEYEVKAAFLYNFAKFVQWPPGAFNDPKQPMGICIYGRDPFGHALEDLLLGKSIGDHPVVLGRAKQVSELAGCQIIFLATGESSRLSDVLALFRSRNVLIVGETEGFAAGGGSIQFVLDQNRVRFAINPDAAERAGLKLSSKLLALAVIVHDADRSAQVKN